MFTRALLDEICLLLRSKQLEMRSSGMRKVTALRGGAPAAEPKGGTPSRAYDSGAVTSVLQPQGRDGVYAFHLAVAELGQEPLAVGVTTCSSADALRALMGRSWLVRFDGRGERPLAAGRSC